MHPPLHLFLLTPPSLVLAPRRVHGSAMVICEKKEGSLGRLGCFRLLKRVQHAAGKNTSVKSEIRWMGAQFRANIRYFDCANRLCRRQTLVSVGRNRLFTFWVGRFFQRSHICFTVVSSPTPHPTLCLAPRGPLYTSNWQTTTNQEGKQPIPSAGNQSHVPAGSVGAVKKRILAKTWLPSNGFSI